MKKFQLVLSVLSIAMLLVFTSSCKKDKAGPDETEANDFTKDMLVESTFDEVNEISDQAWNSVAFGFKSTSGQQFNFAPCATVTVDTVVMPHVMTIDFGDENCLCRDGKYRRGQIVVTFTGRYREPGTVRTHTFVDYYVNDNFVQGTSTLTNMGYDENEDIYFTIVVDGSVTFSGGEGTISWESDHVRTWAEGYLTMDWTDDVYLIEGSSSTTHLNGDVTTREITTELRRELSCHHFVSGTIEITPENRPVRILDFGSGDCDNIATVTINGTTYTISLRR